MPPSISIDGRGWCVSTNTGVWNGGFGPHQPRHSSSVPTSVHGPVCAPNLPRPMISAPMPRPWRSAKEWSTPVGATGLADHRAPEPGGEHPLVQAFPGVTERGVERDAVAGAEPVQGDREVVDTDLGHGCLPSGGDVRRALVRSRYAKAVGSCPRGSPPAEAGGFTRPDERAALDRDRGRLWILEDRRRPEPLDDAVDAERQLPEELGDRRDALERATALDESEHDGGS